MHPPTSTVPSSACSCSEVYSNHRFQSPHFPFLTLKSSARTAIALSHSIMRQSNSQSKRNFDTTERHSEGFQLIATGMPSVYMPTPEPNLHPITLSALLFHIMVYTSEPKKSSSWRHFSQTLTCKPWVFFLTLPLSSIFATEFLTRPDWRGLVKNFALGRSWSSWREVIRTNKLWKWWRKASRRLIMRFKN